MHVRISLVDVGVELLQHTPWKFLKISANLYIGEPYWEPAHFHKRPPERAVPFKIWWAADQQREKKKEMIFSSSEKRGFVV